MSFKGHTSKTSSKQELYFRFDISNTMFFKHCISLFGKQLPCEIVGIPNAPSFDIKRDLTFQLIIISKNHWATLKVFFSFKGV